MDKYCSTRGFAKDINFGETLFTSFLPDQSLLMPQKIEPIDQNTWIKWSQYSYREISKNVFKMFGGEVLLPVDEYEDLLDQAYHCFPEEVAPMKQISEKAFILELFHGPTMSFKDLPLAIAGKVLNYALKKQSKHGLVLVATSGDTGSAVIETTKNVSNMDTIVMFPDGNRITLLQRLLMSTKDYDNIHNLAAESHCDPFDSLIYELSKELPKIYPDLVVTSLNSLLWMRIMQQVVHVVYGYFKIAKYPELLNVVIPTGGGGHLTACLLAKKLSLPIKLKPAFNSNNQNFYQFLTGNEMKLDTTVTNSNSPAMDMQMPCNIERIIYLLAENNTNDVKEHMEKFYREGSLRPSKKLLSQIEATMIPILTSNDEVINTIKHCFDDHQYIIDPHTAVGFSHFYERSIKIKDKTLYLGCASPAKFSDALEKANIPVPTIYLHYLEKLKTRKEKVVRLPADQNIWLNFVLEYIHENIADKLT